MKLSAPFTFRGACDASAGVALDARLVAVADDEDNLLRTYDLEAPNALPSVEDWSERLAVEGDPGKNETDLESATTLDGLTFWIGSHSRSRKGKKRPDRHRLFATRRIMSVAGPRLELAGDLYKTLLADLRGIPSLRPLIDHANEEKLPPKTPGGLNIESLCASPAGELLIGFRNPLLDGCALLVPLGNALRVIEGERAEFGEVIQLDLGGFGLREMVRWEDGYLLIGGPIASATTSGQRSHLFTWAGGSTRPEQVDLDLGDFNPEGLVEVPGERPRLLILSDDGGSTSAGTPCQELPADHPQKHFRAQWLT